MDANTLTVRAERTLGADESAQWLARERPAGSYMRQLSLGDGLDVDGIHAAYENGVLSLTIPVAEAAKPRKIQVRASGQRSEIEGKETISGRRPPSGSAATG